MSPRDIALRIISAADKRSKHPELFRDELSREIAEAISVERTQLAEYLKFLNNVIAAQPEMVRHRLLMGSTKVLQGSFVEEMSRDQASLWRVREAR